MTNEKSSERIAGYDVARSLAIFGMVVHHFVIAMVSDDHQKSTLSRLMVIFDGRPAVLFLILAGIGITLRSCRARESNDSAQIAHERYVLSKRGLLLLGLGFLNLIIWPGDILRVYGIALLLAAWLFDTTSLRLILVSAAFLFGFGLLVCFVDYEQNWDWSTMTYYHLWTPTGIVRNLFYDGFRSVFPFCSFIFFGMWLGRINLRDRKINSRVLKTSISVALVAEILSTIFVWQLSATPKWGFTDQTEIQALFGTESMPPFPFFLAAAGSTAVAVIAICVRISDPPGRGVLARLLAATGRMALTWYFAHIYLGLGTLVVIGAIGNQTLPVALVTGTAFFLVATVLSWQWTNHFKNGPLESGMRYLAG